MRDHTGEKFDMSKFFEEAELPKDPETGNPLIHHIIAKHAGEIWKVRAEPIHFGHKDGPRAWITVRDGELVRIPMLPYRVPIGMADAMLGTMEVMQCYTEAVPVAVRTHIVMGDPVQDVDATNLRLWVGFAARIK